MATTFKRIHIALQQASKRSKWNDEGALAKHIRNQRLRIYKIRGDGSSIDDYMKEDTIAQLILFMKDLELCKKTRDNILLLTSKGKKCLDSEEKFKRQIRSSVKSFLQSESLPMEVILEEMTKIKLPEVPDARTIFERIKDRDHKVDEKLLRKVLFLYACAEGIERKLRIHYESKV